jgi:hypothetical protein
MGSYSKPNIKAYKAGGVIRHGRAVKFGADTAHVIECTAATDKAIGIAQSETAAAEEMVEVALPGGGAEAKAQTSITAGMLLVPHTDATIKPIAAANNRICAMAMDDAVAGDLVPVEVVVGQATATES